MTRSKQTKMDDTMDAMAGHAADLKDTGKAALHDIKARAGDVAATMREGLEARADVARDSLAEGGKRLAESIRTAAGDPNAGTIQAKVLDVVADNVAQMSDRLRGRDLRSLMDDVQGFARRSPAVFVAGAAVAGFAMARFLRASSEPRHDDGLMDADAAGPGGAYGTGAGYPGDMPAGTGSAAAGFGAAAYAGGSGGSAGDLSGMGGLSGEGVQGGAAGGMAGDAGGFASGTGAAGGMADDAMTAGDDRPEDRSDRANAPITGAGGRQP